MASKPILTVLILTYNHEKTLARAIDSVLSQKTTYPYEIIIAEDCSTDGTQNVCKAYAKKYPGLIKLRLQQKNTKSHHVAGALTEIQTDYFTVLEGDDYWSDNSKIQKAVDYLEHNPTYAGFAHDTLYKNAIDGTEKSLVHEVHGIKHLKNPVTFDNFLYLHTTARVYRNCLNMKEISNGTVFPADIYVLFLCLDAGPMYYYDKIMSVYNITGVGEWSKLSHEEQVVAEEKANYIGNMLLGYRHDNFFSSRVGDEKKLRRLKGLFGTKIGWKTYITSNTLRMAYKIRKGGEMLKSAKKLAGRITKKKRPVMLNVGCGTDYKEGWVNIDNNSDNNIEKLDLNHDLRNPLPYKDNSVNFIFNEHFFEHLTVEEGQGAMKEFMRVLKPGGVMRIAMPDLEESIKIYLDKDWKKRNAINTFGLDFVKTRAELLNMSFSWWGHKWIYDWEELDRRLREAGYTKIKRCKHSKSEYADLCNLETREESLLIAEVTK